VAERAGGGFDARQQVGRRMFGEPAAVLAKVSSSAIGK
jgi:hypothetical protein